MIQRRHHAGSTSFIGLAKLTEIIDNLDLHGANLLIINTSLKASQIYTIENHIAEQQKKLEIWDRVDLILKIFQKHARSAEAKLQVELAKLNHLGPRIYNMSEELGREGGGTAGGSTSRGQGETNTEIMKRHIQTNRKQISEKIKKLQFSRENNRKRREKNGIKTASIVGYTNAGKSQTFRSMTSKEVYVKDELFATLDTITGKIFLKKSAKELLISDTIGFIQDLPPKLIEAFKSTLEETIYADILLHIIDASDPEWKEKMTVVESILKDIGCEDTPVKHIFNKIDLLSKEDLQQFSVYDGIFVSAKQKINLEQLKIFLSDYFYPEIEASWKKYLNYQV